MNAEDVLIRAARPEDAAAIADVHIAARRAAMPYLPELYSHADTRGWFASHVLPTCAVWVAEREGRVVGFAALAGQTLEHLYVRPGHQGRGIGGALLEVARLESPDRLELWTFQRNEAARRFYERRGFGVAELTDGSGNEEREPDVRYVWTRPAS
jgi:GNAT superfamily N-acetyltransferase